LGSTFPDGVAAEKFTLFKERFLCDYCSQDTQFASDSKIGKKDILSPTHFDNDSRPTFCPTRVSLVLKVGQSVLLLLPVRLHAKGYRLLKCYPKRESSH
jgi:hypothetical protein